MADLSSIHDAIVYSKTLVHHNNNYQYLYYYFNILYGMCTGYLSRRGNTGMRPTINPLKILGGWGHKHNDMFTEFV